MRACPTVGSQRSWLMHAHKHCCERQAQHASYVACLIWISSAQSCRSASFCAFVIAKVWFPSKAACNWPHTESYLGFYLFYIFFGATEQVSKCMDGHTDAQTSGQTDGRTEGWTNG